ncbi:hypothetical protein [Sulfurospirillum deleyianum]|uniref:Uncharacterized protein n=1 Tax=Sulfurospirillum deleyianum (strain ATCC 51133 / DSM 6946 / 5175) TaxID=525898 RepID=D1AZA8_SULD5|nr:hypothetical protein [Sulfurospirillum deleyianum]ACZ11375.1 hypothetical protein Sdel_0338 [Sulfurospirillum deleyianum DSM 6946]
MTANEAVLEMRYSGIPEEDIEEILEICKKKGLTPQNLDGELEKKGFDKVFEFEYDASESWFESGVSATASKSTVKQAPEKGKKANGKTTTSDY